MNKHVLDFLDDSLSGFIDLLQAEKVSLLNILQWIVQHLGKEET